MGIFLERSPGTTCGELRALMDRCFAQTVDPTEALQRLSEGKRVSLQRYQTIRGGECRKYKFKVVSQFQKAFVVGPNREMEKELLGIFKKGMHSM